MDEQFKVMRMGFRTSQTIGEISKAFVRAQAEFNGARKDSVNPAFRSKYADLSSVIEATQAALNKNGIAILQAPQLDGQLVTITTRLQHESGEFYESDLSLPAVQRDRFDAQSVGSAITYGCRYSMQSMLCVPREDDDGNNASGVGSKEAAQAVAKQKIADHEAKNPAHVPAIFFTWFDESQTARIEGDKALMTANKDLLEPLWDGNIRAVVANADQLESLKFNFEERKVPFKLLKSVEPIETQLKKSIENVKAKRNA
jgi:hypothetical protein